MIASTAFWTLWFINVIFALYGLAADILGLSFFGRGSAPKYHMGEEAAFVRAIIFGSFVMLLAPSLYLEKSSPKVRRCAVLSVLLLFIYLAIPHY